jgi:hypothetical protein
MIPLRAPLAYNGVRADVSGIRLRVTDGERGRWKASLTLFEVAL